MKEFEYLLKELKSTNLQDAYVELLMIIDPVLKKNLLNMDYVANQVKYGYYPTLREFKEKLEKAL